ncbi:MAG: hypothetical protein MSA41_07310 [Clostridium sp.]|nr:hypothetical protein [Clostridium sp.]
MFDEFYKIKSFKKIVKIMSIIISSTNVICITIFLSSVLSCKESEK